MSIMEETTYTTEDLALTGFKTADKILLSWGCTEQQCHTILGISGLSYHKFKSAPDTTQLNPEQFERVSHLLNIHQTLRTTFSTPANLSGFMGMTNENAPFDGRTPLAMIASGELADLREVAQHIDTFKSGLPGLLRAPNPC
ncbi:hypothetical protein WH43_13605 [Rheinheimera sp. KL1]|uniref:antitoxin Xre-like helix-turn-helix domain-containing protein n=1 Tax=Rheinheimera sp. KL1 TaxID=1635005 RepID=UPI0006A990F4|nr:antitoxin Xre-like helix-turn-helix domain-containing protein [Rheinheimera sp. KL1]KOO57548.1 hypothetical protein WH43_13605 [Rheinheimera sp. KL1]